MSRILLAGESWSTTSVHTKGFDSFVTSVYEEGGEPFIKALEAAGHQVDFQPNHVAAEHFPWTAQELSGYDVVVLSDIGANTLLLPPATFTRGERSRTNRLRVLADWVREGGSLLMVGGYLSFQGIEAKANYRNTVLADVLPVLMEAGDDREETPEGIAPAAAADHPVVAGLVSDWPDLLGYQRFTPRPGSQVLATVGEHPLLVVDGEGAGRVAAFASDLGPHWVPAEFLAWPGYATLWQQLVDWLADTDGEGS